MVACLLFRADMGGKAALRDGILVYLAWSRLHPGDSPLAPFSVTPSVQAIEHQVTRAIVLCVGSSSCLEYYELMR